MRRPLAATLIAMALAVGVSGCAPATPKARPVPTAAPPTAPAPTRAPTPDRRDRDDEALARIDDLDARLSRLWARRNRRTVVETVHVQFRPNREELDDGAQVALRAVLQELKRNENLSVIVEGYTDTTGSRDHNLELSRRRAEGVRLYLVEHGVDVTRVSAIGRGPLNDPSVSDERKRRVTIKVIAPSE